MKICLDLQGAQSESRHRGIGRYSRGLARPFLAMAAERHEIVIAVNAALHEPIEAWDELSAYAGRVRIERYLPPGPVAGAEVSNDWRRGTAERLREAFLANLAPDLVYVSSMFEGWVDDSVTSIGAFEDPLPTAATLYDLIPLLRPAEGYLADARYRAFYESKLASLRRSRCLLAISQSAGRAAVDLLDRPPHSVVTIGCGVEPLFFARADPEFALDRDRLGIPGPYVLYVGGFDARKNMRRLLEAYSRLAEALRCRYCLVIAGRSTPEESRSLALLAADVGLARGALVVTGAIDDSVLAALYRETDLFVFPSLHEGFGLPAAEAMAAGAPVIASCTSSMPEVIGRDDALFDPESVDAIAKAMTHALTDEAYRTSLREHGRARARTFTWDACAAKMLEALEDMHARERADAASRAPARAARPKLAFVSPLPPERTGIADYSAGILPALAQHYDIVAIADQPDVSDAWVAEHLPWRGIDWFDANAHAFQRILYHMGNSPFHRRILEMVRRHAGTVVMHDLYMTGMLRWEDECGGSPGALARALYASHGYGAIAAEAGDREAACARFPASLEVVDAAGGVIVHSAHAAELVADWYGRDTLHDLRVVPLYVAEASLPSRAKAREALGIPGDAFVVCSFGFLAPTKLDERILSAWSASGLAGNPQARLVFVGENEGGTYGRELLRAVAAMEGAERVHITGYVAAEDFERYLAAADVAVQLRTSSRGESSWSILRCLAAGIPTIVNAHGAAAEIAPHAVRALPDAFADRDLAAALCELAADPASRSRLRDDALTYVREHHASREVAKRYAEAVEAFAAANPRLREARLVDSIATTAGEGATAADLERTARSIALLRRPAGQRQLLVDVTVVARNDLRTGIERVVRGVLVGLLRNPPEGFRVEPVRADGERYVYARSYASRVLGLPDGLVADEPVETTSGDCFLGLDWYADGIPRFASMLAQWRALGVRLYFVVYDLLPLLLPTAFPESSRRMVETWLATIARAADGLVCISRAVADELVVWLDATQPACSRPLRIGYWPLGATFDDTAPTRSAVDVDVLVRQCTTRPAFLMVGTVEPRKAHAEVLAGFEAAWRNGVDANLVIVGKQGWMMDALAARLNAHPEQRHRLFWLQDVSDQALDALYAASTALIVASRGEGFGLPLVEAARHGTPVIARDLPVFREVAGSHATYFDSDAPADLARTIGQWLRMVREGTVPDSRGIVALDWAQSTVRLVAVLEGKAWYREWPASPPKAEVEAERESILEACATEAGRTTA